jgi:preprotein translocase subunit Sec61beta
MSKKDQMQAPSGMAGLVRYFDEDQSIIKLKPEHVLAICAGIVAIEVALLFVAPV